MPMSSLVKLSKASSDEPLLVKQPSKASAGEVAAEGQLDSQQLVGGSGSESQQLVGEPDLGCKEFGMGKCKWDCGPAVSLATNKLFQSNARALLECHPCYNANRAIMAQAKTPEAKKQLKDFMAAFPELYKLKVRSSRIELWQASAAASARRRASIIQLFTTLKQTIAVNEKGGVLWLKKSEFCNHMKVWEGKEMLASAVQFDALVANSQVTKMARDGDERRVPVMDIPRTEVVRSRIYEKILQGSGAGIQSSGQLEDAMTELADVGTGAASLSHELFGDFARQAQPQGVIGTSTGQQLPTGSRPAPTVSALTNFPEFDNFSPAVPGEASECQLPQVMKKKRGSKKQCSLIAQASSR